MYTLRKCCFCKCGGGLVKIGVKVLVDCPALTYIKTYRYHTTCLAKALKNPQKLTNRKLDIALKVSINEQKKKQERIGRIMSARKLYKTHYKGGDSNG